MDEDSKTAPTSATLSRLLSAVETALQDAVWHADMAKVMDTPEDDEYAAEALAALNSVEDFVEGLSARLRVARMDLGDAGEEPQP